MLATVQLLDQDILRFYEVFYEVQVLSVHPLMSWCYKIISYLENT